jgi:hypothetical protein
MIDTVIQSAAKGPAKERKIRQTDNSKYFTPQQVAARWAWHVESVRRAIRQGRIPASVIYRRILIPISEIERIEAKGRNDRQA